MPPPSHQYRLRKVLIGVICALTANVIFLTSSILVNRFQLFPAELCFSKAILQTAFFGLVFLGNKACSVKRPINKGRTLSVIEEKRPNSKKSCGSMNWKLIASVVGSSFTLAVMSLTAYIGVKLLPVSDLVVFGHTSSVFTLLFSACFLR